MIGDVQKSAIGARIRLQVFRESVIWNLTGKTVTFLYRKPNGATGSWAASLGTAASGYAAFTTTTSAHLNQTGIWELNAQIASGSSRFYTTVDTFHVRDNANRV